jgi:hypothetical protein
MYPLFFYQLPELLPNIAIALGIAPPQSVIRWLYRLVLCRESCCCQVEFQSVGFWADGGRGLQIQRNMNATATDQPENDDRADRNTDEGTETDDVDRLAVNRPTR